MKIVDPSLFDVIKEGIEFQIPCSSAKKEDPEEELLPCMERNEGAVYWLQPKGGTVDQQEACICVNGKFYALNCKFEKAIFRSVRLTRDFQNYERLVDGTRKLVIPRRLFQEKLKTSRRVSACVLSVCVLCAPALLCVIFLFLLCVCVCYAVCALLCYIFIFAVCALCVCAVCCVLCAVRTYVIFLFFREEVYGVGISVFA